MICKQKQLSAFMKWALYWCRLIGCLRSHFNRSSGRPGCALSKGRAFITLTVKSDRIQVHWQGNLRKILQVEEDIKRVDFSPEKVAHQKQDVGKFILKYDMLTFPLLTRRKVSPTSNTGH